MARARDVSRPLGAPSVHAIIALPPASPPTPKPADAEKDGEVRPTQPSQNDPKKTSTSTRSSISHRPAPRDPQEPSEKLQATPKRRPERHQNPKKRRKGPDEQFTPTANPPRGRRCGVSLRISRRPGQQRMPRSHVAPRPTAPLGGPTSACCAKIDRPQGRGPL